VAWLCDLMEMECEEGILVGEGGGCWSGGVEFGTWGEAREKNRKGGESTGGRPDWFSCCGGLMWGV